MEIGVQVTKEDPYNNKVVRATTAYLTFVALDANKRPCQVPKLIPQSIDEIRRFENAKLRIESMRDLSKKLKLKKEVFS